MGLWHLSKIAVAERPTKFSSSGKDYGPEIGYGSWGRRVTLFRLLRWREAAALQCNPRISCFSIAVSSPGGVC